MTFGFQDRLKDALKSVYPLLTPEEVRRNIRGDDRLYVREDHKGYNLLRAFYEDGFEEDQEVHVDPQLFQGMGGRVLFSGDCVETEG